MTTKHIAQGLMMATKARSHAHCEVIVGLAQGQMCHWAKDSDKHRNPRAAMLDLINRKTGIPFDTLMAWYRMGDGDTVLPTKPQGDKHAG